MKQSTATLIGFIAVLLWALLALFTAASGRVPPFQLAAMAHVALEETIWPSTLLQWLAVLGLGLGPVGLAFYVWDYGVKHGDIQVLGASSYLAPLLSTLVLITAGFAQFSWVVVIACLLITGGAMLAAKNLIVGRASTTSH